MSMVLQSNTDSDFKPHPEGIHPAVCVDVIDLGLQETEFQGRAQMKLKLKLVFETEQRMEDGHAMTISKNFTASLHPKSKLAEFLGKWRGRPVVPGETIDLDRLIGASCTLVISHQQNMMGRTYAAIDAISKPTRKVTPSGTYNPAATRQRIAEWRASRAVARPQGAPAIPGNVPVPAQPRASVPAPSQIPPAPRYTPAPVKSVAAPVSQPGTDFDPEVGF